MNDPQPDGYVALPSGSSSHLDGYVSLPSGSSLEVNELWVKVYGLAGAELLCARMPEEMQVEELKSCIGDKLHINSLMSCFDLVTSHGDKVHDTDQLGQYRYEDRQELCLTLQKRELLKISSQRFVKLQAIHSDDTKPTFRGVSDGGTLRKQRLHNFMKSVALVLFFPYVMAGTFGILINVFAFSFGILINLFFPIFKIGARPALFGKDAIVDTFHGPFWICMRILAYVGEAFLNDSAEALSHSVEEQELAIYLSKVKEAAPIPMIVSEAFHTETRSSGGKSKIKNTVKVIDQRFEEKLKVHHWQDDSAELIGGLSAYRLVHIHFSLTWEAGDLQTAQEHKAQKDAICHKAQLYSRRRGNGKWRSFEWLDVEEGSPLVSSADRSVQEHEVFCGVRNQLPWWFGLRWYVLATLCGLSWPYRVWLHRISVKGDFQFSKKVWSHA